ncbi:hypothetical protein FJZ17_00330 [Candidatus Pacearchaeota archaeon]|nr:hypothetical protein [Candidatus Pacearchaeota archaeon]
MKKIKEVLVGSLYFLGYLLSPVSWWNNLLINAPLAYLFAFLVAIAKYDPNLFNLCFVGFYFLLNIGGLLILKYSINTPLQQVYGWKKESIVMGLVWVVIYSIIIIVLLYLDIIRIPYEYFR